MTRAIDLTQPLSDETKPLPPFPVPIIVPFARHSDPPSAVTGRTSKSELLIVHTHAPTHVDSISHLVANSSAPDIDRMPLDSFFGPAVCLDLRRFSPRHYLGVTEFEQIHETEGPEIEPGDIVLFNTDHYRRTAGTDAYITDGVGIGADVIHWLADRGVKAFGVESVSPDLPAVDPTFPAHLACAERRLYHYENLCNLAEVVTRRFTFFGLPLRIVGAGGSPVRAMALLDD